MSELEDQTKVEEIELRITELGEVRETNSGSVQNAKAEDDSGGVQLSLWNDQTGKYKEGDVVVVKNGWCKEYKGQLQLSAGKFGTIVKTGEAEKASSNPETEEVKTRTVREKHIRPTLSEIRGQYKEETYVDRCGVPVTKISV
ncbi:MAG: OB-fold nucleic acid binding domain-containing protein [Candidatus Altiarchaeota archaeon]|nr:OB-fold nucleic acid binding domain-containing protein [Candidatus Altiarchaeota archaeon]